MSSYRGRNLREHSGAFWEGRYIVSSGRDLAAHIDGLESF
jgi:hypothetical protein